MARTAFGEARLDGLRAFTHEFSVDASGGESIELPASLIFSGVYERHGGDLVVSAPFVRATIYDFFRSGSHAGFVSPEGARLDHAKVVALTHGGDGWREAANDTPAAVPKAIGRVEAVTGAATALRNGVTVTLAKGDLVLKGDAVETDQHGTLAITFLDGTAFNLSASARMVLDDMVYVPGGASNSALLSLIEGSISFVAGDVAHTGDMKVETPVATMGIRGTAVHAEIDAAHGRTRFSVMREPDGRIGRYVLLDRNDPGHVLGTVSDVGSMLVLEYNNGQVSVSAVTKTPLELQSEKQFVDHVFQTYQVGQSEPLTTQLQQMQPQQGQSSHGSSADSRPVGSPAPDTLDLLSSSAAPVEQSPSTIPAAPAPSQASDPPLASIPGLPQQPSAGAPPNAIAEMATVPKNGVFVTPASLGLLHAGNPGDVVAGVHAGTGATAFSPVPSSGTVAIAGVLGTLSIAADGTFSYAADHATTVTAGHLASDAFTFVLTNASGLSAASTLTFEVDGGTAAAYGTVPVGQGASASSTPVLTSPEGGDTFALIGPLGNTTTVAGAHGTATIDPSTGTITYVASIGPGGPDVFTVVDVDALGATTTTTADFSVAPPLPDTWLGTTSDDWSLGTNWSKGTPPAAGEHVSIPNGTTFDPSVVNGETVTADALDVANQGTIKVGPDGSSAVLRLQNDTTINSYGIIVYTQGTLDVERGSAIGSRGATLNGVDAVSNWGTIAIGTGATLTLANTVIIGGTIANAGTIDVTGSTIIEGGTNLDGGAISLSGGATFSLFNTAVSGATFSFAPNALLALDLIQAFSATITGFGTGDALDLTSISPTNETVVWDQVSAGAGTLTLTGSTTATFALAGQYATSDFFVTADSANQGAAISGGGTYILYVDRGTGTSGNWATASSWTHGVPTALTNTVIDAPGPYTLDINGSEAAKTLLLNDAGAVVHDDVGGALTLDGALTIEAGAFMMAGGTLSAGAVNIAANGLLEGTGSLSNPVTNAGTIAATGGALHLEGALSGPGQLIIHAGATLELAGGDTQAVTFVNDAAGLDGTLRLDAPATFTSTISGVAGTHDVLDLIGLNVSGPSGAMPTTATTGAGSYDSTTDLTTLTVSDPSLSSTLTFKLAGNYASSTWTVMDDGHGGIDIVDPPGEPSVRAATDGGTSALARSMLATGSDTFVFKASPQAAADASKQPGVDSHTAHGFDVKALAQGDTFVFKAGLHAADDAAAGHAPPSSAESHVDPHPLAQAVEAFHDEGAVLPGVHAMAQHHASLVPAHVEHFHL